MAKVGLEVEGRYQGLRTLFISVDEMSKVNVGRLDRIQQIYISDLNNVLDLNSDPFLADWCEMWFVTVERTYVPSFTIPALNIMLNVQGNSGFWNLKPTDQIKFHLDTKDGPVVKSVSYGEMYLTEPVDFINDKEFPLE